MARSVSLVLKTLSTILLIILLQISFTTAEDLEYRLVPKVKPISYDVTLRPNYPENIIDVTDFEGEVTILVEVIEDTDEIIIHAGNNVHIKEITATEEDETTPIEIISPNYDEAYNKVTEILSFKLATGIKKEDRIFIKFEFTGKLESDMHGFYKSTYTVKNGEDDVDKILLTTQFESIFARKAFPCFDEPKFKAKFKVSLGVPSGYGALSNAEIDTAATAASDGLIIFKETVVMSTYLLAFIVYEEDSFGPSIGVIRPDNVKFTSWGRSVAMKNHLGDYSQTISHRILSELDEFTGIPYSKDGFIKVDQAAIPDFSSGAMENWGLVTYRETGLLFDELSGSESSRKSIAMVIAHELTHQWFGNLVTLDWWSATWLNEGFARFFQYFILDQIHPKWRMMEQFVVDQQMSVFATDALASGVKLYREVNSLTDIDGQFSSAAYQKGGVLVRLISIVLGNHFQMGLNDYLTKRSYETATQEQLFDILGSHYHSDVEGTPDFKKLMEWTTTEGYPVVTFERDTSNKRVQISQKRFLLEKVTDSDTIYPVYLEWTTNEGETAKHWLLAEESSSTLALPEKSDGWFLVNNTGYFRVNYDVQNWRNLHSQLTEHQLDRIAPVDRATLVDNAFNLARINEMQYSQALAIISYLKHETDYIPWAAAFSGLSYLHRMLVNVDEKGVFNTFVQTLIQSVYDFLLFQDRGEHLEKIQRASTLSWACRVGIEDCHNEAVELLTSYTNEGIEVPANLRSVAYCYGIKSGPENAWLKMWQKLEENEDAAERSLLISALGCSQSYSTLYMYLEQSLTGTVIRQQDASSVFSAVYTNPEGVDVALDFLIDNFDRIVETYVSMNALRNTVTGVAGYITKEEQQAKMKKLVSDYPEALAGIGDIALATIETNIEWLKTYQDDVINSINAINTITIK